MKFSPESLLPIRRLLARTEKAADARRGVNLSHVETWTVMKLCGIFLELRQQSIAMEIAEQLQETRLQDELIAQAGKFRKARRLPQGEEE